MVGTRRAGGGSFVGFVWLGGWGWVGWGEVRWVAVGASWAEWVGGNWETEI